MVALPSTCVWWIPEERANTQRSLQEHGSFRNFESRFYTKSGEERVGLFSGEIIEIGEETCVIQVATDITERKRAGEALRRRATEFAALQATVLEITAPHDLPTLLQTIVERAAQLLGAQGGGMYLCDAAHKKARCVVSYNTPHDYTGTSLEYGEGAAGTVAQTGEPLIIDDYRVWGKRAEVYEEEQPFTTLLSAPMTWQNQVIGVIHVTDDLESRRFTKTDLALLTLFASHAAIAVENTRLHEDAQNEIAERVQAEEVLHLHTEQLEALRKVGLEIATQLNLDTLMRSITSRAIELLEAASGNVYLYQPDLDVLKLAVSVGFEPPPGGIVLRRGEGLSGRVLELDEPCMRRQLSTVGRASRRLE